jgi:HAE1 family hydrophobic/amphiphilic exporter-1
MFESVLQAALVMVTIPMAVIGSVLVMLLTQTPVTMSAYIGMIMLGGTAVSAAIILVDKINQSRAAGFPLKRAVLEATWSRLSPIINTSLTSIVTSLPMAFGSGGSSQMWAPLALVTIGGMVVSTFLTLFIIPPLYYYAEYYKERFQKRFAGVLF